MSADRAAPGVHRAPLRGRRRDRDDHPRSARRAQRADRPAQDRAAGGVPGDRPRPDRPRGRADRRGPRVLRRPGPQGAARARRRAARGRAARALQPDHPRRCAALDQPIVGAINGVAAGAGASLAFACDIRLAAEGASFVLAFGRIGLVPDSGATWFLPRLVGSARAAELALTGAPLSAADAERFGLVSRVVPARCAGGRGAGRGDAPGRAGAAGAGADQARARADLVARPRRRRSRTRRTARGSPARRPITPRGSRPSSRSGRLGSPGSSRASAATGS